MFYLDPWDMAKSQALPLMNTGYLREENMKVTFLDHIQHSAKSTAFWQRNRNQMVDESHGTAGFSLVELMMAVAIVAIIAAVALPNYYDLSRNSRVAEATTNLNAIRTGEESYRAEYDEYKSCDAYPGVAGTAPPVEGTLWEEGNADFRAIGFAADGKVRYQYKVVTSSPPTFAVSALGDLDSDGKTCAYVIDTQSGTYPKAERNPGGANDPGAGDDY